MPTDDRVEQHNGPAYVSRDEFDDFKGHVTAGFGKLGKQMQSFEHALTQDARSRANRDATLNQTLVSLTKKIEQAPSGPMSAPSSIPPREDITGRFEVAKIGMRQEIQEKTQAAVASATKQTLPTAVVINAVGTTAAIFIWKLYELYVASRGH